MPSDDKDKNTLYESLLRQGVSKGQIEKVYLHLLEGYGEEETRRRSVAALERLKSQAIKERRAPVAPPVTPRKASSAREAVCCRRRRNRPRRLASAPSTGCPRCRPGFAGE